MKVDVASPDKVFGLQASRPLNMTLLASAFTGHPIGFAAPSSRTGRQRVEVCSLLPQRDCCRFSQHSLDSATKRKGAWPSPEFKEPELTLANRQNPSIEERRNRSQNSGVRSFRSSGVEESEGQSVQGKDFRKILDLHGRYF
jgi:hypothetical protein